MKYTRMPIEVESPEQLGYDKIRYNLTESSYTDAYWQDLELDLKPLVLCYADHQGHVGLRELIASEGSLSPDHVLLTPGAAPALFMVATALLDKGDHMIVLRPNYATNIETPRAIGADISFIDLHFEMDWRIDLEAIRRAIRPQTKLISVTHPHNPTGTCLSEQELLALVAMAELHDCWLLVDETYRDLHFGIQLPLAATLSERVISVSSMSKAYGLPGIRIGWLLCRHTQMMETLLAAKEQIFITGSVLDETVAHQFLQHKNKELHRIQQDVEVKLSYLKSWMAGQNGLEWVEPKAGVVCFPRIISPENIDLDHFYHTLNHVHGTYVGPGHWFEQPRHYMRIGYAWPSLDELKGGLEAITLSLAAARKA